MATENKNLSNYDKNSLPSVKGSRFALVVSQWNDNITENLYKGAVETLLDNGVAQSDIVKFEVPGSFELIFGCNQVHQTYKYDAVIAIGCVIQGDTKHFDFVCEGVTQGIKDLNLRYKVPTIFCVLTDNTMEQSLERSGGKHGNKGVEAAITAIKMIDFNKNV
ncbi:MAG: 6,7-dimethyl-8-ribityllumazine synthase [Bacteroidota bacterium]|nr:6,7-dimethyl-8-ribityllumazine synthase [Bacteroidota bacterium]